MINSVNCGLSPNCFLVARYLRTHNSQRKTNVYKELYITELSFVNISMSCQLLHLMQTLNKPDKSDRNWTELIFVKSGKQILKQPLTRSGHPFLTFCYTGELTGLSNFSSLPSLAASSGWTPPLPLWNVPAVVTMIKFWWGGPSLFRDLAKFSPNTLLLHNQTHHRRCFSWKKEYHWWNPNAFQFIFTLFPNTGWRGGKSGSWQLLKLSEHLLHMALQSSKASTTQYLWHSQSSVCTIS